MPASYENAMIVVKVLRITGLVFFVMAVCAAFDAGGVMTALGLRDMRYLMAGILAVIAVADLVVVPAILRRAWRHRD